MKLYRIHYRNSDANTFSTWSGTLRGAWDAAKALEDENDETGPLSIAVRTDHIEVPTDKAGLLKFLNEYAEFQ